MRLMLACLLLAVAGVAGAQPPGPPPPAVAGLNPPPVCEQFEIMIENSPGARVAVSRDGGETWTRLGWVLRPAEKVNPNGYTASLWAPPGSVAATAVNAIHIKTTVSQETGRGVVFSVLPAEFAEPRANYGSYLSPTSSIQTDIPAGHGIFGGGCAPLVGNQVLVNRGEGLAPLPADYVPARGDRLVIMVARPVDYPSALIFDNKFGGLVTMAYPDGRSRPIAQVLRPVLGVGRFEGGLYTGIGRIRANHSGVIDVSVSPVGQIGGFQIIPAGHAMSPEMGKARTMTQWMVVGPLTAGEGVWEGVAPLFLQYLRPQYDPADLTAADWHDRLLARFLVDVRRAGHDWGPIPHYSLDPDLSKPLPEWTATALAEVEQIRILFPLPAATASACAPAGQ